MYEIINNVNLKIKEYKGQRVVTFKDIDMVHGRPAGTAKRNFNKNRDYFIEGEDFFIIELTGDEIRTQFGAGKNAGKTLILLTESGYLMIVKSFTNDLAWSVQRELVRTYFRTRQMEVSYILKVLENQEEMKKKLDSLEKKLNSHEKKSDSNEKKLESELIHIRNYCKLCTKKIDDMEKVFRKSLSENNQVMFPAFMDINKNILKMKYDVLRIARNLISYYFYE